MISGKSCVSLCAGLIAAVTAANSIATTGADSAPILKALRQRDCGKAVQELNAIVNTTDHPSAIFVGARMLDEGICVSKNTEKATKYFARAAELGDADAGLDYAAKLGLGEGAPQDYVSAGEQCHKAGIDPSGLIPFYSLGYACTVRGVAGRLLRQSLPQGAFDLPTPPAIIEFKPGSSEFHVVSAPASAHGAAFGTTGSHLAQAAVDPRREIEKAWRDAIAAVPKPDSRSLTADVVKLPVDLDMTLESSRDAKKPDAAFQGDTLFNDEYRSRLNVP